MPLQSAEPHFEQCLGFRFRGPSTEPDSSSKKGYARLAGGLGGSFPNGGGGDIGFGLLGPVVVTEFATAEDED